MKLNITTLRFYYDNEKYRNECVKTIQYSLKTYTHITVLSVLYIFLKLFVYHNVFYNYFK